MKAENNALLTALSIGQGFDIYQIMSHATSEILLPTCRSILFPSTEQRNLTLYFYRKLKYHFTRKTKTMHNYLASELHSGVFVVNPRSPFKNLATREGNMDDQKALHTGSLR